MGGSLENMNRLLALAARSKRRLARHAEQLVRRVARDVPRLRERFYDVGEALDMLQRDDLYRALDYRSLGALLTSRGLMCRMTAHKLRTIVTALPRSRASILGLERAYALARVLAHRPDLTHNPSLATLSSRALARLARGERVAPAAHDAASAARALAETLRRSGAKNVRTTARRRRPGGWRVVVELDVPDAERLCLGIAG